MLEVNRQCSGKVTEEIEKGPVCELWDTNAIRSFSDWSWKLSIYPQCLPHGGKTKWRLLHVKRWEIVRNLLSISMIVGLVLTRSGAPPPLIMFARSKPSVVRTWLHRVYPYVMQGGTQWKLPKLVWIWSVASLPSVGLAPDPVNL